MSAKGRCDPGEQGTILQRQPRLKYEFQGHKLPKEPTATMIPASHYNETDSKISTSQGNQSNKVNGCQECLAPNSTSCKPVAVVGALYQGQTKNSQTVIYNERNSVNPTTVPSHSGVSSVLNVNSMPDFTVCISSRHNVTGFANPPQQFIAGKNLTVSQPTHSIPNPSGGLSASFESQPSLMNARVRDATSGGLKFETNCYEPEDQVLVELAASSSIASQVIQGAHQHQEHVRHLEQERDHAKQELDVQLQVNAELKKLLVASVGEDLSWRVERLARDRAQLSIDVGGFSKKISEDYENFDKVSIQADMWRSKYLASRVMVEELGNARAYYSLQLHDSQDALQQLLIERHELRTNLLDAYRVLQQVKIAFDPLNSHGSSSLPSGNVLHLTQACQQLAEAVRFRLLPSHIAMPIMDTHSWQNAITRAEQFAHEVLSRPIEPSGSLNSGSSRLLPVTGPAQASCKICRFHPNVKHENLTFNCCNKCKGDVNVL